MISWRASFKHVRSSDSHIFSFGKVNKTSCYAENVIETKNKKCAMEGAPWAKLKNLTKSFSNNGNSPNSDMRFSDMGPGHAEASTDPGMRNFKIAT